MRCLSISGALRFAGALPLLLAVIALSAALAGCSASRASYDYQSQAGGPPVHRVAIVPPPKVEIEPDGLPGQLPPLVRARPERDDPSEPFSPNYGPPPSGAAPAIMPPAAPVLAPRVLPRQASLTAAEADAVMGRAIAAHEARRP